jgi:putative membrane protein
MQRPLTPDRLWTAWTLEPSFLIPFGIATAIYIMGTLNIWRRAGKGHGISTRSNLSFSGAVLTLIVIFVSPLDALSDALFSAHMVQHMLLILVAAPLLLFSDFPLAFFWALPRHSAQSLAHVFNQSRTLAHIWRTLSHPICAWILFVFVFWIWHASVLYEAALQNEPIHMLEHSAFLLSGMLFWWVLLKPTEQKYRRYGLAIPYLFTTLLQSGILGALITFGSRPWYSDYAASVQSWGLTPLQDQQLAGLIMWILGGAVFTLLTIGYFAAWLRALEQRSVQLHPRNALRSGHELP